jgi:cell division topological specificity factor
MRFFKFMRRRAPASVARERLRILLEYERSLVTQTNLVAVLREEILAVVSRHVAIDRNKVQVSLDRGPAVSLLAVDIEIPNRTTVLAGHA